MFPVEKRMRGKLKKACFLSFIFYLLLAKEILQWRSNLLRRKRKTRTLAVLAVLHKRPFLNANLRAFVWNAVRTGVYVCIYV